jgi:hypothetical protein
MAVQRKLRFILAVTPECTVAADLLAHISRHGGTCRTGSVQDFSVYFGASDSSGAEVDGWVLGDREEWESFRGALSSQRLRAVLVPGAWLQGPELRELMLEVAAEHTLQRNADGEPLIDAISTLAQTAARTDGTLFVQ